MASSTCAYITSEIYRIVYGMWSIYYPGPEYIEVSTPGAKLMVKCTEGEGKPVLSVGVVTGIYSSYEYTEVRDVEGFLRWLSTLVWIEKKARQMRERFVERAVPSRSSVEITAGRDPASVAV